MARNIVFPIPDGATYSNDFGAARSGGRKHGGNDLFAPRGTPVVAVEDGTITAMGFSGISGNRIWLNGAWFYAHLDSYAKGLRAGMKVRAGQVIGYVGDTGNAKGTSPHLHFAHAPSGYSGHSSWSNPYELLRSAETGAAAPVAEEQAATDTQAASAAVPSLVDEAIQSIPGRAVAGAAPGVPEPGTGPLISEPEQPPLETWRLLSQLPDASPETQRYFNLARMAEEG